MRASLSDRGFTLTEVLAALVIFSFAILGLTQAAGQSAASAARLKSKSLAAIVADNEIARLDLTPVSPGSRSGSAMQMGRTFDYVVEASATDAPGFLRIDVTVRELDSEQALIKRTAFKAAQ
ncbi:type II secretion system minor pseudopilin GspI [Robiginitomaculum antarcticum]|uniref:type II secretion system minor pseudopilin GspI n=1 Tax=Robiginitomaculum antarcticum TaxID=437507 RepID=UPI0003648452|nr:type II secretion system minor pseudopilin GspI [Robiginitomaculum antarcticum]